MTKLLGLADDTAQPGALRADQRVLDVLLGDRRPALGVTAEDVVLRRPGEPGEREAGVGVEVAVFGRHHRVPHMHRYLVDVDVDPVAFGRNDFGELTAVAGQDRRDLVGADVTRLGHVDDQVRHPERHDGQHDQGRHRHVQPAADPLPVDLLHGGQAAGRSAGWSASTATRPTRRSRRGRLRRRGAVERRLDGLDRVAQRRGVLPDRWDDGGQSVVGWHRGPTRA